MKGSWVQEPEMVDGDVDEKEIEKKVNAFKNQIDNLIKNEDANGLKELIKKLRSSNRIPFAQPLLPPPPLPFPSYRLCGYNILMSLAASLKVLRWTPMKPRKIANIH